MSEVKVSVVMPVFNRAHMVYKVLDSLAEQTFKGYELIIVDDASSDKSDLIEVVKVYENTLPSIVLVHHVENKNAAAARNTGFSYSKGALVAFLDSDDTWLPRKLEVVVKAMEADKSIDILYSGLIDMRLQDKGMLPSRAIHNDESVDDYLLYSKQSMQTSTLVIRRSFALNSGLAFDESLRRYQDYDYCISADRLGARFHFLPQVLVEMNDFNDEVRISRSNCLGPTYHWLNKIHGQVSNRAYHTFKVDRLVKQLWRNGARTKAFLCIFNFKTLFYCRKNILVRSIVLLLIPLKLLPFIKSFMANSIILSRRNGK